MDSREGDSLDRDVGICCIGYHQFTFDSECIMDWSIELNTPISHAACYNRDADMKSCYSRVTMRQKRAIWAVIMF